MGISQIRVHGLYPGYFSGPLAAGPPLGPVFRVASEEQDAEVERGAHWAFRLQGKSPVGPEVWDLPGA